MTAENSSRQYAPIAALVLDIDGLLIDSETVSGEALRLFLHGHGHEMLASTLEGALGPRLPEAVALVAEDYSLPGSLDELVVAEVQFGKPAPDLFLLAAERLGVPPESCVVMEDAPAGLEAAARAGMRRVWVPNAHTRHLVPPVPVDATLESLADAIAWLESQGIGDGRVTTTGVETAK